MKKILEFKKNNEYFEIFENQESITKIYDSNLFLSGKDIYYNLFDKYPIDDPEVQLEMNMADSIIDSNDIRIAEEIEDILKQIAKKIEENKLNS